MSIVKHNYTSINGAWNLTSKIAFLSLFKKQSYLEGELFWASFIKMLVYYMFTMFAYLMEIH